ncbi:TIM barrel protein [Paracoccus laeviglucosivorans]|uniref:2-keto-myo-inositol isomerase n=1 Tax=Paracoccus laeviglucosivorans TaxID=1197861 RepID=K7ZN62_9RHOB|nr:TIM barrel protein [Paracoccus laeviglucosivorans]BAM68198.1 putative inosose isomerase iolI [Paracoccus laeviglucosivorans]SMO43090.1 2-keto-myo-inositol isomerase [Paracoccus laeviglucosivorans]
MRFALNHICAPQLSVPDFFALAQRLGCYEVEIRNDLPDVTGQDAAQIARQASDAGLTIISVNALYPFNLWSDDLAGRAERLADFAARAGAQSLVMCPLNDGHKVEHSRVVAALENMRAILKPRGLKGLVEPLGFPQSSLRRKDEAVAAITEAGGFDDFALLHDTFHHHLAGDTQFFPHRTALVHVSGVTDPALGIDAMLDAHRVLVDGDDRLENAGQLRRLLAEGYDGPISFEPFAPEVHALPDIEAALRDSMDHLRAAVEEPA